MYSLVPGQDKVERDDDNTRCECLFGEAGKLEELMLDVGASNSFASRGCLAVGRRRADLRNRPFSSLLSRDGT
jgi:hypothetical protein